MATMGLLFLPAKMWTSHRSLPWALPGPTSLVSPGQVGSYKDRQGLHSQLCPVAGAGPGAAQGLCRQQRWWQGIQVHQVVHGIGLLLGKTSTQSPSQGLNLHPNKGSKLSPSQKSNQRSRDLSRGLMVHQEPWAHGVSLPTKTHPPRISLRP